MIMDEHSGGKDNATLSAWEVGNVAFNGMILDVSLVVLANASRFLMARLC